MKYLLTFLFILTVTSANTEIKVGLGKTEITPPLGTPSAGYATRKGAGMEGVHDPLFAIALLIDNGEKQIVLCSVDHLGFTYEMVQEITKRVHAAPQLKECEIYIASSHTHSGGGAFLNIPLVGEMLAGAYDPKIVEFYIEKTAETIIQTSHQQIPAKIGIGYGKAGNLSQYRGTWPADIIPVSDIALIKVTRIDGTPLAVLFNYAIHPTVLRDQNRLFSADFVGYARDEIQACLGVDLQPLYFNGAQGDILPIIADEKDRFISCEILGKSLAKSVIEIWKQVPVSDSLEIKTRKVSYTFQPQPTSFGLLLPLDKYQSEMNLIVLNRRHAFITIPGELSTIYDRSLKEVASKLGYSHLSIFGLTNDAHGYIISPDSWRHKTYESSHSFGGENYGEETQNRAEILLSE